MSYFAAFLFSTTVLFSFLFLQTWGKLKLFEKYFSIKALPLGKWHVIFLPPHRVKGYYYALVGNDLDKPQRFVLSREPIPLDFEVDIGPHGPEVREMSRLEDGVNV